MSNTCVSYYVGNISQDDYNPQIKLKNDGLELKENLCHHCRYRIFINCTARVEYDVLSHNIKPAQFHLL